VLKVVLSSLLAEICGQSLGRLQTNIFSYQGFRFFLVFCPAGVKPWRKVHPCTYSICSI